MILKRFVRSAFLGSCVMFLMSCHQIFSGFVEHTQPTSYIAAWQPNSNIIAVLSKDLTLYSVENGSSLEEIITLERDVRANSNIAWSPNGEQLAEVGDQFRIWNIVTQTATSVANQQTISSVTWSPDGTKLATGDTAGTVQVWDANTLMVQATLTGHTQQVNTLSWSSNSSMLASGSSDGRTRIWNVETGASLNTLELSTLPIFSIAWRPESTEIALGGIDENVRIWNITDQAPEITFQAGQDPFWIAAVTWSPDGNYLAIASGSTFTTWDISTNQQLITFHGHTGSIDSISWKSDGNEIVSTGKDNTVRIWDADTGEALVIYTLN